jgi:hypothetical protein
MAARQANTQFIPELARSHVAARHGNADRYAVGIRASQKGVLHFPSFLSGRRIPWPIFVALPAVLKR